VVGAPATGNHSSRRRHTREDSSAEGGNEHLPPKALPIFEGNTDRRHDQDTVQETGTKAVGTWEGNQALTSIHISDSSAPTLLSILITCLLRSGPGAALDPIET
jgi:hypothetical protein